MSLIHLNTFPPYRRAHKKSRNGCQSCKARRIKCGEEKPHCENCTYSLRKCVYPFHIPLAETSILQPVLNRLDDEDTRYFKHVFQFATPNLPHESGHVWSHEVPQLAHQHIYLMHALLGLGASHIQSLAAGNQMSNRNALNHRMKAIEGLRNAISCRNGQAGEADAILATCYTLTFQSLYLDDGMPEFITFVRGCYLVSASIWEEKSKTAFDLTPDRYVVLIERQSKNMPEVSPAILLSGLEALDKILPILRLETEFKLFHYLRSILTSLQKSSQLGYIHFISFYELWKTENNFQACIDTRNKRMQILLLHYIAENLIFAPLCPWDWPKEAGSSAEQRIAGMVGWMDNILADLPDYLIEYVQWPKTIADTLRDCDGCSSSETRLQDCLADLFLATPKNL